MTVSFAILFYLKIKSQPLYEKYEKCKFYDFLEFR